MAGVFVLVRYGQSVSTHDVYIDSLLRFGLCQLNGNDPSCPDHEDIIDKTSNALNIITFFILGLVPLTSLSYAVKTSDIKKLLRRLRLSRKRFETTRSTLSDSKRKDSLQINSTTLATTSDSKRKDSLQINATTLATTSDSKRKNSLQINSTTLATQNSIIQD